MKFTKPMEWNNNGIEPSEILKQSGFKGGYKPPAEVFNYFLHNSEACITELQTATTKAQNTADKVKTLVENAQNTADDAKTAADNAQRTADDAVTDINELKDEVFTKTKSGVIRDITYSEPVVLDVGFTPKTFDLMAIGGYSGLCLQWTKSNGWTGNAGPLYDYDIDFSSNTVTISTHLTVNDSLIWRAFG